MSDVVHPTAKVLGVSVETSDGDFEDMAECPTPLGRVFFSRYGQKGRHGYHWRWGIETAHRQVDDFDTMDDEQRHPTLESAASHADKCLRGLMKRFEALPEFKLLHELETAIREYDAADIDEVRRAIYDNSDHLDAIEGPKQVQRYEDASKNLTDKLVALNALRKTGKVGL